MKSPYKISSFLMPLADVPNHRFSRENGKFEEEATFKLVPEPGFVGFKVDHTFNEGLEGTCTGEECEEYNFSYVKQASNAYLLYSYGMADLESK